MGENERAQTPRRQAGPTTENGAGPVQQSETDQCHEQLLRRCEECGAALTAPRTRFCPMCGERRRLEANRQAQRRYRQRKRQAAARRKEKQKEKDKKMDVRTVKDPVTLCQVRLYPVKAHRREDGVLMLPAQEAPRKKKAQTKLPKGAGPQSLEAVLWRLERENERRKKAGQQPLSYGRFVAIEDEKEREKTR